jgi:hypothetical protein
VRKTPLVVGLLSGMRLTQGAITQACPEPSRRDALRRAKGKVSQQYEELRCTVRNSSAVYNDDTGWKVDGENPT